MAKEIIEFGGQSNVILRAICDFTVNGIQYKEGDVLLMLNGVNLEFTYNETIKDKTVGSRNLLAFDIRKLNAVRISSNPLTMQYINLFAEKMNDSFIRSVVETTGIADNEFYPIEPIIGGTLYIEGHGQYNVEYNEDSGLATINKVIDIDKTTGENILEDILETGDYTIVYQTLENKPCYDINNNYTLPYFSMEIIAVGNTDKETSHINIYIPAVSLLTRPDYSLTDRLTYQSLDFKVIETEKTVRLGVY